MTSAKFTPGPWRLERPQDDLVDFTKANIYGLISEKNVLGYVPKVRIIWTNSTAGGGFFSGIAFVADDNIANGHLIAAAPDMFAALTEIEDTLRNAGSDADLDALASLAREAIARATNSTES